MRFFQRYFLPGFVFMAVLIGGGYATGREVVQFFYPLGAWDGLKAQATAAIVWSLVCAVSFELARLNQAYDYRAFIGVLLGPFWFAFELAYVALLMLVLAVLGAAAGTIATDSLQLPSLAGTLVMMGLVAVFVFLGSGPIEKLLAGVALLLYGFYVAIVLWSFAALGEPIAAAFHSTGSGSWLAGGITYAGYNTAALPAVLFCLRHQQTRRQALVAGALAGPIAMLPGTLLFIALHGGGAEVAKQSVPIAFLLDQLQAPWFKHLFEIVLFAILIKTGTALLHSINERLAGVYAGRGKTMPASHRSATSLIVLALSIFAAQAIGLIDLIAKGYGGLTYAFIALLIVPVLTIGVWKISRTQVSA